MTAEAIRTHNSACCGTTMPIAPPKISERSRKPATTSPKENVASTMYTPRVRRTGNEMRKPTSAEISVAAGIMTHIGAPDWLASHAVA